MNKLKQKGFTLLEIIIVVAIMGGLSMVVFAGFPSSQEKARDTQRKSDLSQYQTALANYASNQENGLFPVSSAAMELRNTCSYLGIPTSHCPQDPKFESGQKYWYQTPAAVDPNHSSEFVIWTKLENKDSYWVMCSNGLSGFVDLGEQPTEGLCPTFSKIVIPSVTPTPTPITGLGCNEPCLDDSWCASGHCNTDPLVLSCVCPVSTTTPTPTPTLTPTPIPECVELLGNGGFETGTSPWKEHTNGRATFLVKSDDVDEGSNAGFYKLTSGGSMFQLYQLGFEVKAGSTYRLTFAAKTDVNPDYSEVRVELAAHSPWKQIGASQLVDISESWNTYAVDFSPTNTTDISNARFRFRMTYRNEDDIYRFDSVSLRELNCL